MTLQLNDDKTEFLGIGTPQQSEKIDIMSICVGNSDIHLVPTARNLGSWFDSRLSTVEAYYKDLHFFIFLFVQNTTHQELPITNVHRDTHLYIRVQSS